MSLATEYLYAVSAGLHLRCLERRSVKIRRSKAPFRQRQPPRCNRRITCVPWIRTARLRATAHHV